MHFTISWERTNIVHELLDIGADPQIQDGWGHTCLQVAQVCPNKEVLEKVTKATTTATVGKD